MPKHTLDLPREVTSSSVIAYARLYQFEYWTRELAYLELKANFGTAWWSEAEAAIQRSGSRSIPAGKSLSKDKKHRHMVTPESDPLWFLTFDGLLKVIFDNSLWPLFEPYLTTKELLEAKFQEILPIRNRVSHNRPLHDDDLDRLNRVSIRSTNPWS